MEAEINQQTLLAGYISRMWANLLKLGQGKITLSEVRNRLERLDDYWKRFQDVHFVIAGRANYGETDYAKKDLFSSTEEDYFQMRAKFQEILAARERADSGSRGETRDPAETSLIAPVMRHLQLPKLALPKFSGDQLAWEGFRDLFRSLVHDVSELPGVQKLQYLKSCLSGEAAELVANTPLTDAAYQIGRAHV